jgi:YHS domain-containing protein
MNDVDKSNEAATKTATMKSINRISHPMICGLALGMAVLTSAAIAADTTNAPTKPDLLTTCPVSGDKLGEMGKPYVFVYQDQEVKLCCPNCKKDFDKDPAPYLKKIRAAGDKAKN